ncbi:SH3 domain-containing protein [Paraburkholderia dipogonis]|uniref:SH3 domain-containing protein n=2 Tax=Paraburkholderia dipogonis TaxID=1211383 RepID=UPI001FCC465B|nr:SH3 domain-containing protein [Paraburkholderia dipogonis]
MKQHLVRCLYAAAGVLALPAVACAQSQAYTNTTVNVRAGPAPDYPVVTQLPGGVPLSVMGCISNYQWCDVAAPNLRGWVYAGSLSYPYQGANVPVMNYGMVIGLPIVTFSIGAYWGDYYRGRPWYGQQSRWAHHPPPPPPRPGAGRPPGHDGGRPPGEGRRGMTGEGRRVGRLRGTAEEDRRVGRRQGTLAGVRRVGSHQAMRADGHRVVSHRVMRVGGHPVVGHRAMQADGHPMVHKATRVAAFKAVLRKAAEADRRAAVTAVKDRAADTVAAVGVAARRINTAERDPGKSTRSVPA